MGTVCTCGGTRSGKSYPILFDDDVTAQYIRIWWVSLALQMRKRIEEFNTARASKKHTEVNALQFYTNLNAELQGFLNDIYGRHDYSKSGILDADASRDLLDGFIVDEQLVVSALRCCVEYESLEAISPNGRILVDEGWLKARHTILNEINGMCLSYKLNPGYYHTKAFQVLDTNSDGRIQRDVFFACLSVGSDRFKEFIEALGFKQVDVLALNVGDPDLVPKVQSPEIVVDKLASSTHCFPYIGAPRKLGSCFQGVLRPRLITAFRSKFSSDLSLRSSSSSFFGDRSNSSSIAHRLGVPDTVLPTEPCGNANLPKDYSWLTEVLDMVASGKGRCIVCEDLETGAALIPLFFLAGACPSTVSPMQAVMFSRCIDESSIDFWWVKPQASDALCLERETLKRHCSGIHKNDPGRSKPFLQQVADLFAQSQSMNGWRFGVHEVGQTGNTTPRAYLCQASTESEVLYISLMWQEDWTLNPFATPFIKGKLIYQKDLDSNVFWSRQYEIYDGVAYIAAFEEGPRYAAMPGDDIKQLWELGFQ